MDSYTRTHQCCETSKNVDLMPSRGLTKKDNKQTHTEREREREREERRREREERERESVLSPGLDNDNEPSLGCLVLFNGISITLSYLMPNPVYSYILVLCPGKKWQKISKTNMY